MKYTLSISAALLLAMSQAQPSLAQNGASNLVKQAIAAEGGADALRALKGLAIKGEAKFWEPGQSKVAGGEPKLLEEATFTITWDLAKGMARTEWDRDHKYPDPVLKINYIETVLPTLGFVTDQQGAKAWHLVRLCQGCQRPCGDEADQADSIASSHGSIPLAQARSGGRHAGRINPAKCGTIPAGSARRLKRSCRALQGLEAAGWEVSARRAGQGIAVQGARRVKPRALITAVAYSFTCGQVSSFSGSLKTS